jgi:putative ABC transport system permease protein
MDHRILLYVGLVVCATTLISGLLPAFRASGTQAFGASLDAATRSAGNPGRNRGLKALVVAEVTLSTVLVVVAALSVRDLRAVMDVDPGFQTEGVLAFGISLPSVRYEDGPQRIQFFEDYLSRVRALPGVNVAGVASAVPMGGHWGEFFVAEGAPELGPEEVLPVTLVRVVTPDYLEAMGVTLLEGRLFREDDGRDEGSRAVILNETWARNNFPEGSPVGKRIHSNWEGAPPMTVVGVTKDTRHYGLDEEMRQGIFQPLAQVPIGGGTVVIRTSLDPLSLVPSVRALTREMDPDLPIIRPRTMGQVLDQSLWGRRILAWLFGAFAVLALILAVGGIYGVLSYTVTQRNLEIGIRMALGAQGRQVMAQVVRQGMVLVGVGVIVGILAAYAMARAIATIFFGVGSGTVPLYLLAALGLLLVGFLANLVPARRASRVHPMTAVRAGE